MPIVPTDITTRITLGFIALVCLGTVVFGYLKIDRGSEAAKRDAFQEEYYKVVESAQIWYIRPVSAGGGGMSFETLDFGKLTGRLSPESLVWTSDLATYSILHRSFDRFVIEATPAFSGRSRIDTLHFDSLPIFPN
jgi:hypothetical protein